MKGLFKGLKYTLSNLSKKKVTYDYPNQPLPLPDRFRGIQKFYPEKCIVCNQCSNICPTDCIQLTGKKHPDPAKKGKLLIRMILILKFVYFAIYVQKFARQRQLL